MSWSLRVAENIESLADSILGSGERQLRASKLLRDSLKTLHSSPVECLGGVLDLICATVGCDYGLILTVDQQKQALLVDVLQGYTDEETRAYRSERLKLPIDESQSVAAKALADAIREHKSMVIIRGGDDPINYQIAPVEETLACAVDSTGDFVSVLVLERKQDSSYKPFIDNPEITTLVDTAVQLVSIALATRQSFVFKFDEFIKQSEFLGFERFGKDVVRWVYEKFGVNICSLYFSEYDNEKGKEYLICQDRLVKGMSEPNGHSAKIEIGEDYAGWIAANNSTLITFADNQSVINVTSHSITPNAELLPVSKMPDLYPAIHFKSYLGVPITDGKEVVGVLEVVDAQREYSFSDQELLEMIADRIGSEYLRISRDVRRESLFDVPNIETRDLRLVIRGVVDAAMKVAAATHGLFMFKDEKNHFVPRAVRGYGLEKASIPVSTMGQKDLTNWVMNNTNKPAFVCGDIRATHDIEPDMRQYIENTVAPNGFIPPSVRSVLLVPVYLKDPTTDQTDDLGVLVLMSPKANAFQRDEVVITALAEIVSYHIWANKKTAELESTSEKVSQLEQAMPHYNRAAMAAAASAGTVHSANKHVKELNGLIHSLVDHQKVKETRDLLRIARIIEAQFSELAELYDKLHRVFRGSAPTYEPCDLAQLVQEVRSYMEPKFKERHVAFKNLITQSNLPKVNLDPVLMKVVFINLINNSIDANAREITVGARKTAIETAGIREDAIEMSFKDNGEGIQSENIKKIFDLFFTSGKKNGTGLGLSVNHDIMDKHRGTISLVSSTPGQGALFSLKWPMNLA